MAARVGGGGRRGGHCKASKGPAFRMLYDSLNPALRRLYLSCSKLAWFKRIRLKPWKLERRRCHHWCSATKRLRAPGRGRWQRSFFYSARGVAQSGLRGRRWPSVRTVQLVWGELGFSQAGLAFILPSHYTFADSGIRFWTSAERAVTSERTTHQAL